MTDSPRDRYDFSFWLKWILWFAGSFLAAALVWTLFMSRLFGALAGKELTITWATAVFGSWFLLVMPFMRKKEQIWKRLNEDQESAVDAWLGAMGLWVLGLVASALFWSFRFKERILIPHGTGLDAGWAKAVFASWLVTLIPFLAVMYRKADQLFKTAVIRQTGGSASYRRVFVEKSSRRLPRILADRLRKIPSTLPKGHVVHARLRDGRRIPHVFVLNAEEILGLYDRTELDFDPRQIVEIEPVPCDELPPYEESRWLRLDG